MKELLRKIILDFQESTLEPGSPRRLQVEPVPGKATVCIGVRRSGKSTYLHQVIQRLYENGVSKQNILYLNFFDDRLHQLNQTNLGLIAEAYFSLYPEKNGTETIYFFFDEIQSVSGWEPFIDRMLRTEKCEVYLTGSSARMLSKEIATQMRGRALSWEVFPFSFHEFLDSKQITSEEPFSTKKELLIQQAFEEYWLCGGFPEVLNLSKSLRIKIHQEYLQTVLFRDLIERHDISHPKAVSDLAHWLIDNTSSLYTINKLTGYIKSLGHRAHREAISNYVGWFEDAYFLFTVRLFDASLKKSNTNPKKIYCIDHSFVTSVSSGILINRGHLLENLVFISLRRIYSNIYYYKTKTGKEVDFIVPLGNGSKLLVQACESLVEEQTKKREITALNETMKELDIQSGIIVTRNQREEIETTSGTIKIIPAWNFLMTVAQVE